jgi:hypothetical protein
MAYLIEVPVEGGGWLLAEAGEADLPSNLELAAVGPGAIAAQAQRSLQEAIDQVRPAIEAVRQRLATMGPDEVGIEFGIVLGAETGAIVAMSTAEAHFTDTLTWKRTGPDADTTEAAGDAGH